MKINLKYILFLLLAIQFSIAQKKDENIGTEVVNVVKPYTPTISDAFKIKEIVPQQDDIVAKKEVLTYTIFSIPVASTFNPSKGVAANVDKAQQEKLFANNATFAAGNYGTINTQLYVTTKLENDKYISANFRHLSSQGGIKNTYLKNNFFDTALDATYGFKTKALAWKVNLGIQNQMYNWYGVDQLVAIPTIMDKIDPKQSYITFAFGGQLQLLESILKETDVSFTHFADGYKSTENRLVVQPKVALVILNEKLKLNFNFDYLKGAFNNEYLGFTPLNYGFTNLGFQPNFTIIKKDLSLNVGISMIYSVANEAGKNKFYMYPNITASYTVVGDFMIAFAGAEGGLNQNSYHNFVQLNNFVAPTLTILPTDKKFDIYAGLRGKLSNSIGYNAKASLVNEDYKPLFKNSIFKYDSVSNAGFTFGNSFEVIYDTVKTIAISGELSADFSQNVTFKVEGIFSKYVLSNQTEPWNLPNLQINSNLDFKITEKWNAGIKLFFIGERKDQFTQVSNTALYIPITKTLDGYFDLNARINYNHNKQLGFFIKGNNLANQSYQRFLNYPVQGIQALLGANYKFDF